MAGLKPYDITNLITGSARVLLAPISQAVPTKIQDVIGMVSPYNPVGAWFDLGAQKSSFAYSRSFTEQGIQIEQTTGDLFEEITDVNRTARVSIAEISPANLQIVENAPSIDTIAAVSGASSQKGLRVGSFDSLVQYRLAFFGVRNRASGIVTEPGGAVRGRLVGSTIYRCSLSADSADIEYDKGNLAEAVVTFVSFPEAGQPAGQEYAKHLFEDAGTIT